MREEWVWRLGGEKASWRGCISFGWPITGWVGGTRLSWQSSSRGQGPEDSGTLEEGPAWGGHGPEGFGKGWAGPGDRS